MKLLLNCFLHHNIGIVAVAAVQILHTHLSTYSTAEKNWAINITTSNMQALPGLMEKLSLVHMSTFERNCADCKHITAFRPNIIVVLRPN